MGLGITEESSSVMEIEKDAALVSRMAASQMSLDSMATMTSSSSSTRSEFHSSTTSLQSTQSMVSSGYSSSSSSMAASSMSLSKAASQSTTSLTSSAQMQSMSVEKSEMQMSSSTVEQKAVQEVIVEKAVAAVEMKASEPIVTKSAVTQIISKPNVTVKETIHLYAGTLAHEVRSNTFWTEEEVLPPTLLKDGWVAVGSDGILAVRQFDFAPSPVKEILLFTSVTKDPPVEFALQVKKNAIHTTCATLITMEKGELKLIREEIEEDEGMFEEYWEEVRVAHYEEEQRKSQHRRMMMEERIEETRRIQERRQQLLKRIEETKGIYSYSGRRSYDSHLSVDSPHSYRTMDSFGSVTYSPR